MKKIGMIALAAFIGGAAAIGSYKFLENNNDGLSIAESQNVLFASNPVKISSAGTADFVQAASAVSPAVVHIKTTYGGQTTSRGGTPFDMMEEFFGGGGRRAQRMPRAASGSGVILTTDGYIVTNNHVVENAEKIEVVLSDRRKVAAKVVGRDPNTDLALIKVEEKNLPIVKMGNSDDVQVGEWVLAVGFPLDLQTTVTAGIVSAKSRSIGILGRDGQEPTEEEYEEYQRTGKAPTRTNSSIESFIQTDAAINRGNSGGALVNANGELVGINAAIASQTGMNEGYGFAIPVNLAKKVLEDFRKYGEVRRGFIGVTFEPLDADSKEKYKVSENSGLYVNSVMENSGASAAGIKKGDIIKKVEGKEIFDSPDLQERIGRLSPGDKVQLTILREGNLKNFNVTLKSNESATKLKPTLASNEKSTGATISALGATFEPVTAAQKAKYGLKNGVVITSVVPGKAFDNYSIPKGLIVTSVNGKPVNNVKDVEAALPSSKNGLISISAVGPDGTFGFSFPVN
jgi:serine protease Do